MQIRYKMVCSSFALFPVASENPVEFHILKSIPFLDMLSSATLMFHAELLQDPSRSGIAREVIGMDAIEPQRLESVPHNGTACFCTKAFVPIGSSNPEPYLCVGVPLTYPHQADRTNELPIRFHSDCKLNLFPCIEFLLVL